MLYLIFLFGFRQDMVPVKPTQEYTPRVYGFKINSASLYYRNNEEGPVQRRMESRDRTGSARRKTRANASANANAR